eukprot:CAMPEP_0169318502 /NCGR_PEP_ID=MMETSP1017-20121227/7322_1 /TAXON_ID=342587 /ORGANISM="Karlodinium micrum, Strain CCMP2283" /LENGTH=92 /DNA_ID=CAMNT_0009412785 /DNA_START=417 /DNA_END=695 /DNA_ORIENTATION=-
MKASFHVPLYKLLARVITNKLQKALPIQQEATTTTDSVTFVVAAGAASKKAFRNRPFGDPTFHPLLQAISSHVHIIIGKVEPFLLRVCFELA